MRNRLRNAAVLLPPFAAGCAALWGESGIPAQIDGGNDAATSFTDANASDSGLRATADAGEGGSMCGGIDCTGGECQNGRCLQTLAANIFGPTQLVVTPSGLYYPGAGGLVLAALDGSVVSTLSSATTLGLVADTNYVYWSDTGGNVWKASAAGGGNWTQLVSNHGCPFQLAVDSSHLYWVDFGDCSGLDITGATDAGSIVAMGLDGGATTTLASFAASGLGSAYLWSSIALGKSDVYWTLPQDDAGQGVVLEVGMDGGPVETVYTCSAGAASGLVTVSTGLLVDAPVVYWTGANLGLSSDALVEMTPEDTATPALDFSLPMAIGPMASDGYSLYVGQHNGTPGAGSVLRTALDGGSAVTLWSGLNYPSTMRVDSTSVYWTDLGVAGHASGGVYKLTPR